MTADDPPPSSAAAGSGSQTHITGDVYGPVLSGTFTGPVNIALPKLTPVLHQLRAPLGDFVGRTEAIAELVTALRTAAQDGTIAAIGGIQGLGGVGKTELAFMVAHAVLSDFPDAQIVVALAGASANPLPSAQALQRVIRSFEREAQLPEDTAQLQAIYTGLLSGKRALILADDAKDAAHVRALLPPAGCALLITSRTHFSLPGMHAIDLGVLSEAEARALLLEICPRIGADAPALAQLCGFLPLALRISASLLRDNPTRQVARYLEQLQATRLAQLADPDDPAVSVEASLSLSYDALPEVAQNALTQLSVFPTDFDQAAALAVVQVGTDAEATLELLMRRNLLEWQADSACYTLHDLVRVYGAARLDDAEAVLVRHARHYQAVAEQAENLYLEGGDSVLAGLALFDRERVNIDAGWAWAMAHAGTPAADHLLLDYAYATIYVGDLRYDTRNVRIPQLEAQRDAARRLGQRADEGNTLGNLGLTYAALGEVTTAIAYHEQSLAIARELDDQRGEGAVLGNLGLAYAALGDPTKAIAYYAQGLTIAREVGDRRGEGAVLDSLGNAYADLGDHRKASEYYEQSLAIKREFGDLSGEGNVLNNLGLAYADQGDLTAAIAYYEQSLAITRELGNLRGEGNALSSLGITYAVLGDTSTAIAHYEQSLAITREVGDRRGEGGACNNLGLAYADLGDTHKAIVYYEQSLAIKREIGDRAGEARTSWNLGLIFEQQGNLARAVDLLQVSVDYMQSLGHPDADRDSQHIAALRQRLQDSA